MHRFLVLFFLSLLTINYTCDKMNQRMVMCREIGYGNRLQRGCGQGHQNIDQRKLLRYETGDNRRLFDERQHDNDYRRSR